MLLCLFHSRGSIAVPLQVTIKKRCANLPSEAPSEWLAREIEQREYLNKPPFCNNKINLIVKQQIIKYKSHILHTKSPTKYIIYTDYHLIPSPVIFSSNNKNLLKDIFSFFFPFCISQDDLRYMREYYV